MDNDSNDSKTARRKKSMLDTWNYKCQALLSSCRQATMKREERRKRGNNTAAHQDENSTYPWLTDEPLCIQFPRENVLLLILVKFFFCNFASLIHHCSRNNNPATSIFQQSPPPPQETLPGAIRVPGIDGEYANDNNDLVINTTVASKYT